MTITTTVEWVDANGVDQAEDVEFESEPFWDNDSFSYAGTHCTGGKDGVVNLPDYPNMESTPEWDTCLYSDEVNMRIGQWRDTHLTYLKDLFCKKLENEND